MVSVPIRPHSPPIRPAWRYIARLEELVGVQVTMVSVGANREAIIRF